MNARHVTVALLLAAFAAAAQPAWAVTVKGFVRRAANGNPVANVDLDVFDVVTGASVFIINDLTGSDGFYQIVLDPGAYNITYTPPRALRLAGHRRAGVAVSGGAGAVLALPDTLLEPGLLVGGHVQDTAAPSLPAANVEVRFFDAATGLSVFAAANATDAAGAFSVLVPARTYDLIYAPAAGDTLLPLRSAGIVVSTDVTLPTVSVGRGFLLEGDVLDPNGAAVAAADADVFDAFTGDQILTVHDDTGALGRFRFAVPPGTLDMNIFPPAGPALAAASVEGIVVTGPTTEAPVTLPAGVTLSGRVLAAGTGQPISGVDLSLVNLDTGRVQPTARDDTDAAGGFAVNVPAGLYDARFNAPVGSGLASAMLPALGLTSGLALADTLLPSGRAVSGRILDADAPGAPAPVAGVAFIAFDDVSGKGFPAAGPPSAADGSFTILLPAGKWIVEPLPPRGTLLLTRKLGAVDLTLGDALLGDVALPRGVTISGRVLAPSGPVRHVDVDVFDATGARMLTPHDDTDPLGSYSVVVATGPAYTLRFEPPRATDFAAAAAPAGGVVAPTILPDVVLQRGVVVTGRAIDPSSVPVYNVDLTVRSAVGIVYDTPHDNTLSDGTFKFVLPPGGDAAATLEISPPRGSRLLPLTLSPVNLTTGTALGDVTLASGQLVSGRVTRPDGSGVRDTHTAFFDAATGVSIRTPNDTTDGAGDYVVAVPPGTYNVQYVPPPPQPGGERLVPSRLPLVVVGNTDVTGLDVALPSGVWARGRVIRYDGSPVSGADLDFVLPSGAVQFTPTDATDPNGVFSLVVPPDTYAITVEGPAGSRLLPARREGVDLHADQPSLAPFVLHTGYLLQGSIFDSSGQPVGAADQDLLDAATGLTLLTLRDDTDAAGFFSFAALPGTWDLRITPPANSNLPSFLRPGVAIRGDTILSDTFIPAGFRVEGKIFDSGSAPVPGAGAVFVRNGGVWPAEGNVADLSGRYRTLVPAGTYDVVLTPPAGSGLAPLTLQGIVVSADTVLADAHLPASQAATLASISPAGGAASGGSAAALSGGGFVAGAEVFLGGVEAQVTSLSPTSISIQLPPHPPAVVDVSAVNPGSAAAVLAGGFVYLRPSPDIDLQIAISGDDLVLTWTPTGQASYAVFRAGDGAGLRAPLVVGRTGATTFTIVGGAHPAKGDALYDVE